MSECIQSRRAGRIGEVVLNRPQRHNSLVPELLEPLRDQLRDLAGAEDLDAILLRANGPSFSTGGDVRRFSQEPDIGAYSDRLVGALNDCLLALHDLPCPVICAVQGLVTGGSVGFLLASDIVVMAETATITPWYGVVGFSPDGGWTAIMPNLVGRGRVADTLMLNQTIRASDAVAWGVATRQVPGDALLDTAWALARQCGRFAPGSLRSSRALLRGDRDALAAALDRERERFVAQIVTDEAREGMKRYLEGTHR